MAGCDPKAFEDMLKAIKAKLEGNEGEGRVSPDAKKEQEQSNSKPTGIGATSEESDEDSDDENFEYVASLWKMLEQLKMDSKGENSSTQDKKEQEEQISGDGSTGSKFKELLNNLDDPRWELVKEMSKVVFEENKWFGFQMKFKEAVALHESGEYLAALELLKDVADQQKTVVGETDDRYVYTAHHLGLVYIRLEKYEEALKSLENACEILERILGIKENKMVLVSLKNVIAAREKFPEAENQGTQDLDLGLFLPENSSTVDRLLAVKRDIADIKVKQKDFPGLVKVCKESLEIQEAVLEVNHSSILETKVFFAAAYYHLGEYEESLALLNEVHESRVQKLGEEHPDTIVIKTFKQHVEKAKKCPLGDSEPNPKDAAQLPASE